MDSLETTQPIQERWGEALNAGFLVIPVALLRHQRALGLDTGALTVLLNILGAWWYADRLPFPSSATIATRMGTSVRTVQRHLARLEALKLLRRLRSETSDGVTVTKYDPEGLVLRLKALGMEVHPRRQRDTGGLQQHAGT